MKKIITDYYFITKMLEHIEKNNLEMQPSEINMIIKIAIDKNKKTLEELEKQILK